MTFVWLKNDTLIVLAGPVVFELREGIGCVSTAPTKSGASVGAREDQDKLEDAWNAGAKARWAAVLEVA